MKTNHYGLRIKASHLKAYIAHSLVFDVFSPFFDSAKKYNRSPYKMNGQFGFLVCLIVNGFCSQEVVILIFMFFSDSLSSSKFCNDGIFIF